MNATETKTILEQFAVLDRAIVYARVSGDDTKKEGRNIESQLDMGREYAQEKDYRIINELYEDPKKHTSGHEIDLPVLNQIREMANAGQFDVLVVRELDRLSRNFAKQLIVEEELKRAGVRVEYVLAEYDDTPEGRLQKHIRATIAEYEREKIKERVIRGKRNKARVGKVIKTTKPPYGLIFSDDNFAIVETEARIVKSIVGWCLEGKGNQAIADELNRLNVPVPKQGERWRQSTVNYILKNRTYIGEWEFGKATRINGKWVHHPTEHRIKVEVPAIIDEVTFEQVQEQLKANIKLAKRNTKRQYLIARRVTCQCGTAVLANTVSKPRQKEHSYYVCDARRRANRHDHACNTPYFRTGEVDEKVWAELTEYIHNPVKLQDSLAEYQREMDTITRPLQDRLQTIDDLLTQWQTEWDNATANLRAAKTEKAKALFANDQERIEKTIGELAVEKKAILAKLEKLSLTDHQVETLTEFAVQMAADWEVISRNFESRRAFIDMLDIQVTLMITPQGKRKGLLSGKLPGGPKELLFEDNTTPYPDAPGHP